MMEQGKKVYPAEEADAMLGFLKPTGELEEPDDPDYDDDGNEIPSNETVTRSRFDMNVFKHRAWCSWAVGCGIEEGWIMETQTDCVGLLEDAEQHLKAFSSKAVPSDPRPVFPTTMRRVPIAFSASAAEKYAAFGSAAVCERFDLVYDEEGKTGLQIRALKF